MTGTIIVDELRSQSVLSTLRSDDPANPSVGDRWVRDDVTPTVGSVTAIGVVRIQGQNGTQDWPIISYDDEPELGADVYPGLRLRWNESGGFGTTTPVSGFVPVTDQGGSLGSPRLVYNGTEYQAHDSLTVGSDIPDSVVSRTETDDSSVSRDDNIGRGLRITTAVEWSDRLDVEVSANTSGIDEAEVYRVSDGQLIGDATGLNGASGGDRIAIPLDSSLQPDDGTDNTKYNVNLRDADGSFVQGFNDGGVTVPIESADGNLTIVDFSSGPQSTSGNASCIVQLGNLGL